VKAIAESTAGIDLTDISASKAAVIVFKTVAEGTLKAVKSSPVQPKDYVIKQRQRWLNKLATELWAVCRRFPFPESLPKEICPEWVWWIQQEFFRATYPQLEVKESKEHTVLELAGFLGYQCAYAVWMKDCFEGLIKHATENPEKYKNVKITAEESEKALNYHRRWHEWYEALRHLAGRALKSCIYQQYEDTSAFMGAFDRGFARKPKSTSGTGNFGNSAFGIYHFMLSHWRAIELLSSVRELHEMLGQQMGKFRTGDLKRIEKICQRCGKHFRKPGRPRASK
jgi:hypothetical protein